MRRFLVLALFWAAGAHAQARDPDPWLGPDKAVHFGVSVGLSFGAYEGTSLVTNSLAWKLGMGAGVSLAAGAGKELYDLSGHGDPSWKDFTWDVVGTAVGLGIAYLLDVFVFKREPRSSAHVRAKLSPSAPAALPFVLTLAPVTRAVN